MGSFGSEWSMCYSFARTSCTPVAHFQLCRRLTHPVEWLCLVLRDFLCFHPCDGGAQLPRLWNAPGLCFRYAANLNKRQLKRAERDVTSPSKDLTWFCFNVSASQGCKCPLTSRIIGEDGNATSGQRTEAAPALRLSLKLQTSHQLKFRLFASGSWQCFPIYYHIMYTEWKSDRFLHLIVVMWVERRGEMWVNSLECNWNMHAWGLRSYNYTHKEKISVNAYKHLGCSPQILLCTFVWPFSHCCREINGLIYFSEGVCIFLYNSLKCMYFCVYIFSLRVKWHVLVYLSVQT